MEGVQEQLLNLYATSVQIFAKLFAEPSSLSSIEKRG
jgi:hypothetical protein